MSLATVEERLARLEVQVDDLRVSVSVVDHKLDLVRSTLDRRLGVESLGKYVLPLFAVIASIVSLAFAVGR